MKQIFQSSSGISPTLVFALVLAGLLSQTSLNAFEPSIEFVDIPCDGEYAQHLQGVCTNNGDAVYWSFTTALVKTDPRGQVLHSVPVVSHHGDLCFEGGRIYVAVNLGKFNDPEGHADSWVYVYDSDSLKFLAKHETQEAFHGAGGIGFRNDRFYVVGGLPNGVEENYVYEYDRNLVFLRKHTIRSGWTRLGIQTATWHDDSWWFGCYGGPKILLKTDGDFNMQGRYEIDASLGIIGLRNNQFLVATGPRTGDGKCLGRLHPYRKDSASGLVRVKQASAAD